MLGPACGAVPALPQTRLLVIGRPASTGNRREAPPGFPNAGSQHATEPATVPARPLPGARRQYLCRLTVRPSADGRGRWLAPSSARRRLRLADGQPSPPPLLRLSQTDHILTSRAGKGFTSRRCREARSTSRRHRAVRSSQAPTRCLLSSAVSAPLAPSGPCLAGPLSDRLCT